MMQVFRSIQSLIQHWLQTTTLTDVPPVAAFYTLYLSLFVQSCILFCSVNYVIKLIFFISKAFLTDLNPTVTCTAPCFNFCHVLFHLWDHSHHFPLHIFTFLRGFFLSLSSLTNSHSPLRY